MNRWYSSQFGRFTTPDPYQGSAGLANPQSWNRYAYVLNDPVNYTDRTGLVADSSACGAPGTEYCIDAAAWAYSIDDRAYLGYDSETGWIPNPLPHGLHGPTESDPDSSEEEPSPEEKAIKAALSLSCNKDVREAMNKVWMKNANGKTNTEGGFRLDRTASSYSLVEGAFTNEQGKLTLTVERGKTFAIFHTHPDASGPQPSTPKTSASRKGDTWVADEYGLDMFVMSSRGLWYYDHNLKKSFQLQSLMDWTKPCPP